VEVIGCNEAGQTTYPLMFAGKKTSWIRDNETVNVKTSFGAAHDDVVILNPLNGKIEIYNHDLTNATNRAALKAKLVAAATPADTDNDKIPDYWEQWAYGTLAKNGASAGAGGYTTLMHYAYGNTSPASGVIPGLPKMIFIPTDEGMVLSLRWTRRRGTAFGLTFTPEFSNTLGSWTTNNTGYADWSSRILYDGSGSEMIEWRSAIPDPLHYARVKVMLP
jgi:hypothetical protein